MTFFSLDHSFSSSRSHCQSILESCFSIDPGYLRPVLQGSQGTKVMTWFYRPSTEIETTITAWVSKGHPHTGYIGLVRSQHEASTDSWNTLFEAAENWLKLQGVKIIFAPVDGATWFDYRLGTDVDQTNGTFSWEPAPHQILLKVIENRGYTSPLGYHSTGFNSQDFPRALKRLQPSMDAARKSGVSIKAVEPDQAESLLEVIFDITTEVYAGAPCFESIHRQTFEDLYAHYNIRRNISHCQIMRDPNMKVIGFLYAFEERNLLVIKTIGILLCANQFFPSAKTSASQAMLYAALHSAQNHGLAGGVAALVRDSASSRFLEKTQIWAAEWQHRYRLYQRNI